MSDEEEATMKTLLVWKGTMNKGEHKIRYAAPLEIDTGPTGLEIHGLVATVCPELRSRATGPDELEEDFSVTLLVQLLCLLQAPVSTMLDPGLRLGRPILLGRNAVLEVNFDVHVSSPPQRLKKSFAFEIQLIGKSREDD